MLDPTCGPLIHNFVDGKVEVRAEPKACSNVCGTSVPTIFDHKNLTGLAVGRRVQGRSKYGTFGRNSKKQPCTFKRRKIQTEIENEENMREEKRVHTYFACQRVADRQSPPPLSPFVNSVRKKYDIVGHSIPESHNFTLMPRTVSSF